MKILSENKDDDNKKKCRVWKQEESLSFSSTKKETFDKRIQKNQEKSITAKSEPQPLIVETVGVKKEKIGFIDGLIGPIDIRKQKSEDKKNINLHEKESIIEQKQKQETEKGGEEIVSFSPSWRMPFLSTIITAAILCVIYMITILVKPDVLKLKIIIGKAGVLPIARMFIPYVSYILLLIGICCSLYWFRWLITCRYTITPQNVTIHYLLRRKKIIIPINKIVIADEKIQNVFQEKLNTGDALIFTYGSFHKRIFRLVNIPASHEKVSLINEYSKKTQEERLQKKIELITGTPKMMDETKKEKGEEEEQHAEK